MRQIRVPWVCVIHLPRVGHYDMRSTPGDKTLPLGLRCRKGSDECQYKNKDKADTDAVLASWRRCTLIASHLIRGLSFSCRGHPGRVAAGRCVMQAGSRSSRTMAPNRRNPPRGAVKHWELDSDRRLDERPPDDRMDVVGGPAFETHECPV